MPKHKDPTSFFHDTLQRHHGARRQGAKVFGRMAKAATDVALREALQQAHDAAERHSDALDTVFAAASRKPHEEACDVTDAQVADVKHMIGGLKGGPARDEGLAAAAAMLEGHAANRLALLRAWAMRLDLADALPALDRLWDDARRSRDRFAALVGGGERSASRSAAPSLTPKQAALLGLR